MFGRRPTPGRGPLSIILVEVVERPVEGRRPSVLECFGELEPEVLQSFLLGQVEDLREKLLFK